MSNSERYDEGNAVGRRERYGLVLVGRQALSPFRLEVYVNDERTRLAGGPSLLQLGLDLCARFVSETRIF